MKQVSTPSVPRCWQRCCCIRCWRLHNSLEVLQLSFNLCFQINAETVVLVHLLCKTRVQPDTLLLIMRRHPCANCGGCHTQQARHSLLPVYTLLSEDAKFGFLTGNLFQCFLAHHCDSRDLLYWQSWVLFITTLLCFQVPPSLRVHTERDGSSCCGSSQLFILFTSTCFYFIREYCCCSSGFNAVSCGRRRLDVGAWPR